MKKLLLLLCQFLLLSLGIYAQLGFTVAPTQASAPTWQVLVENYITQRQSDFLKHGITATADYHFPIKNTGWEIGPSVHLSQLQFDYLHHEFRAYTVGMQSNFNFTPFRKWQAEGKTKSRLYFQVSPGINYVRMRYFRLNIEEGGQTLVEILSDGKFAPNVGLNLLLDFHLTDLLTVAPMGGIRYFPNLEWEGFSKTISEGHFSNEYDRVDWRHICFGIRIGLNLKSSKMGD